MAPIEATFSKRILTAFIYRQSQQLEIACAYADFLFHSLFLVIFLLRYKSFCPEITTFKSTEYYFVKYFVLLCGLRTTAVLNQSSAKLFIRFLAWCKILLFIQIFFRSKPHHFTLRALDIFFCFLINNKMFLWNFMWFEKNLFGFTQ